MNFLKWQKLYIAINTIANIYKDFYEQFQYSHDDISIFHLNILMTVMFG